MPRPPKDRPLTARTAGNALINTSGALWSTILAIVATPVIIRALGAELYGVYILVVAVTSYIGLVELNLSSALVKYVAEHAGRDEPQLVGEVIGNTVMLYLVLSTAAATVFLLIGRPLLPHLNIPANYLGMAWRALVISAVSLPLALMSGTLVMLPAAIGRFDVSVVATAIISTASTAATVVVALLGGKLVALALVNAVTALVATITYVAIGKQVFIGVPFRPRWNRTRAATLLQFSAFSFLSKLSGTLVNTIDRLAISVVLGPAAVAYYSVPASLLRRIGGLTNRMAYVVLPVASELTGRLDYARLRRAYVRASRMTWYIGFGVSVALCLFGKPLLALWVGHVFAEKGVWVLRALAAAFALETLASVPSLVTEGMGHPRVSGGFALA